MTAAPKVCGFCKGQPVGDAASWLDGRPRPPLPCPRCGKVATATGEVIERETTRLAGSGPDGAQVADTSGYSCSTTSPLAAPDDWATVIRAVNKLEALDVYRLARAEHFNAVEAINRLRAADQANTEALREAVDIVEDSWNQWAYDIGGGRKINGGLSTLEWIEEALPKLRAALAAAAAAPEETT